MVVIDVVTVAANLGVNQFVIKFPNSFGVFGVVHRIVSLQAAAFIFLSFVGYVLFMSFGDQGESSLSVFILVLISRVLNLFGTLYFSPLEGNLDYNPIVKTRLASRTLAVIALFSLLPFLKGSIVLGVREFVYTSVYLISAYYYSKGVVSYEVSRMKIKAILGFTVPLYSLNIFESRAQNRFDWHSTISWKRVSGIYYGIRQIFEGFYGFIAGVIQTVVFSVYSNVKLDESAHHKIIKFSSWMLVVTVFIWGLSFIWGDHIPRYILGVEYTSAGTIWLVFIAYFGALIVFENSKVSLMSMNAHGKMVLPRIIQFMVICTAFLVLRENVDLFWSATILYAATLFLSLISLKKLRYVWNSRSFSTK